MQTRSDNGSQSRRRDVEVYRDVFDRPKGDFPGRGIGGFEQKRLEIFIGKWINEGHTISDKGAPGVKILTSDEYEWMPGGFFILQTAYGRIGATEVGGTEIIAYNPAAKKYTSYFFDSQGNVTEHELTIQGNQWVWLGKKTKATATFEDNGKTQSAVSPKWQNY